MSTEFPVEPVRPDDPAFRSDLDRYVPTFRAAPLQPRFQHRYGRHVLLLLLAAITTTLAGADHYAAFASDFGRATLPDDIWYFLVRGAWYSGTVLAILGAHEMGHYLACRYYNVDATLPYFLPFYLPGMPFQTGTFGAVIRIREIFPNRKVLFDIGVAGPIAGFLVLVPALFFGLSLSHLTEAPTQGVLLELGEPLLFRWAAQVMFGAIPDGQTINMHPMVFASWFGMLATAINLLPFGQLDGGHITYASLGRLSTPISIATVGSAVAMTFVSPSWIFMTIMMLVMLLLLGPRHPRVLYEHEPLDPARRIVAILAFGMLAICFTPVPIRLLELLA